MTPSDLKAYIEVCREHGVLSFKSGDIEITLSAPVPKQTEDTDARKKVEQMLETIKLDDDTLIDRIFPQTPISPDIAPPDEE